MRVRFIATVTAALAAVLATAGPALAATSASVTSPAAGSVVTGPTPIEVQVSRDLIDRPPSQVEVRLSADGQAAADGTTAVALDCIEGCNGTDSTWGGATLQPATAAPFSSRAVCNGRWYLQPSVDGGAYGAGAPIVFSSPGSPVSGFSVTDGPGSADLQWIPAGEPDISGYRIERRVAGGDWGAVTTVGPSATSYRDEVAAGDYAYRIVTLRPDGQVDGQPAAPCADGGQDLATTSGTRSVTVPPAPAPSPSADGGSASGAGTSGQSTSGQSTGSPTDQGAGGSDGTAAGTGGTGRTAGGSQGSGEGSTDGGGSRPAAGDASGQPTSGSPQRVAPPPAPRRSTQESADAPALPVEQRSAAGPRYYGEDQPYSDTLSYGDAPVVAGRPAAAPSPSAPATATATGDALAAGVVDPFGEQSLELGRILRPVAVGLLLVAIGLHLRRWLRETDVR